MSDDKKLPIIFLAYANDHIEGQEHLRNLEIEISNIKKRLEKAESEQLCRVITLENATVDLILSVFQECRDTIAIFHFAGHANGFHLLLKSESGHLKTAYAGGLATFLGQQKALELVFLNGCSTEHQVQGLLNANCSSVIATSEPIDDKVAKDFATYFYRGLGTGASIEKAYNEAVAGIEYDTGFKPRALYWGTDNTVKALAGRNPWLFRVKPGAETVKQWNLPDAADNPLFSLPRLPKISLPETPFRQLEWFNRNYAGVFFGRGFQIRELYEAITTESAPPIVLFSGQSGVGKSSVLHAGLLPRLEDSHDIYYFRRDPSQGLLEMLISAFGNPGDIKRILWKQSEDLRNRPIIVILDQVEEVFIDSCRQRQDDLETFMNELINVFGNPEQKPRGRLVLGFRKEWMLEIKRLLEQRRLPFREIFIETINRRGIIEAITGLTRFTNLKDFYKLEIEAGLASEIADDLLADRESPVAPVLQILLTKLWNHSNQDKSGYRKFTRDLYLTLKQEGLLLGDFIDQQLRLFAEKNPKIVADGLTLDFLYHHTNANGTAAELSLDELVEKYPSQLIADLVQEWKGNLLSDRYSTEFTLKAGTRLAHDTLAPLIRERFEKSDAPGQRAMRILENRSIDWTENRTGPTLDDTDLELVNAGLTGMRRLTEDELRLVKESGNAAKRRKKKRQLWISTGVLSLFALTFLLVFGWFQQQQTEKERVLRQRTAYANTIQAAGNAQRFNRWSDLKKLLLETDPSLRGWEWERLQYIADRGQRLNVGCSGDNCSTVAVSNNLIAALGFESPELTVWRHNKGKAIKEIYGRSVPNSGSLYFSPDQRLLILVNGVGAVNDKIFVWEAETGRQILEVGRQDGSWRALAIDKMASIVVEYDPNRDMSRTGLLRIWDLKTGQEKNSRSIDAQVKKIFISPDSQTILTLSEADAIGVGAIKVERWTAKQLEPIGIPIILENDAWWIMHPFPNLDKIMGQDDKHRLVLWDLKDNTTHSLLDTPVNIDNIAFSDNHSKWAALVHADAGYNTANTIKNSMILVGSINENQPPIHIPTYEARLNKVMKFDPTGEFLLLNRSPYYSLREKKQIPGSIEVFNLVTWNQVLSLSNDKYTGKPKATAFLPDGRMLASGEHNEIDVYDLRMSNILTSYNGHKLEDKNLVHGIAIDVGASFAASIDKLGDVLVWTIGREEHQASTLEGPLASIEKIAWTDDSTRIVAAGAAPNCGPSCGKQQGHIAIWNHASKQLEKQFSIMPFMVKGLALVPNTTHFLAVDDFDKLVLWDFSEMRQLHSLTTSGAIRPIVELPQDNYHAVFTPYTHSFRSPQCAANGKLCAVAALDGAVRFWLPQSPEEIGLWRVFEESATTLVFLPSINQIAVGSGNGWVKVGNVFQEGKQTQESWSIQLEESAVNAISVHPNGHLLAVGLKNGKLFLLDSKSGNIILDVTAHVDSLNALTFGSVGFDRIATVGSDGQIKIWDYNLGVPLISFDVPDTTINTLAFSSDGKNLAAGSSDGRIFIWETAPTL